MGDASRNPSWLMDSAVLRGVSVARAALNQSDKTKGKRHSKAAPEVNLLRPYEIFGAGKCLIHLWCVITELILWSMFGLMVDTLFFLHVWMVLPSITSYLLVFSVDEAVPLPGGLPTLIFFCCSV